MPVCPASGLLERLLAEALADGEAAAIEAHVEQCSTCQAQLERLTASAQWSIGRISRKETGHAALAFAQALLHRLTSDRSRPSARREHNGSREDGRRATAVAQDATDQTDERSIVRGYEILEELGRGATSIVYKARQVPFNRVVALKLFDARGDRDGWGRFRREVEALAGLQHPNLVRIYEVGNHGGRPFFAMEFVSGKALHQHLLGEPLPVRRAAELVEGLARGVQAAHDRGIVHRDLKPANVLLTPDGIPKIADFGLAKHLDQDPRQTRSGAILGTPRYMAPEQADATYGVVGPLADIYSLGAILYECLTGRPPFQGRSIGTVVEQVGSQEPVSPRHWQPKVPSELESTCLKCLAKQPSQRYASARELADELRRYLNLDPSPASTKSVAGAPVPVIDGGSLTLWRDTEKPGAARQRLAPVLFAFLWPVVTLIGVLFLLALVRHLGLIGS